MSQIQISLEGSSAIALAEALKGLPGFEVSVEVGDPDAVVRGGKEVAAGVLLTLKLVNTGIDTADNLLSFAEHVRNFQSPPVTSALIVSEKGDRVKLKDATPAQIIEVLKGMK